MYQIKKKVYHNASVESSRRCWYGMEESLWDEVHSRLRPRASWATVSLIQEKVKEEVNKA